MSIKKMLKKILPNSVVSNVKNTRSKISLLHNYLKDEKSYSKFSGIKDDANEKAIKAKLIFFTHSVEKGLSHPHFRPKFGSRALNNLNHYMTEFRKFGYDIQSMEYQNAISVLNAYDKKHKSLNIDIPEFHKEFDKFDYSKSYDIAGSKEVNGHSSNVSFCELVNNRHSVREFDNSKVDIDKVRNAISTSIKTPSVCNRQPWKVYLTENPQKIESLLQIQGGYKGYGIPPVLSLISVDLSSFISVDERNEPFVDGGMFTMSYLYSLTNEGLASCTLNTMSSKENLSKIKKIMEIPESEVLISFVAIGNYKSDYLIAKSHRKNIDNIMVIK